jgi:hypothetical protein
MSDLRVVGAILGAILCLAAAVCDLFIYFGTESTIPFPVEFTAARECAPGLGQHKRHSAYQQQWSLPIPTTVATPPTDERSHSPSKRHSVVPGL